MLSLFMTNLGSRYLEKRAKTELKEFSSSLSSTALPPSNLFSSSSAPPFWTSRIRLSSVSTLKTKIDHSTEEHRRRQGG